VLLLVSFSTRATLTLAIKSSFDFNSAATCALRSAVSPAAALPVWLKARVMALAAASKDALAFCMPANGIEKFNVLA